MSRRKNSGPLPDRDLTPSRHGKSAPPASANGRAIRVLVLDDDKDTCEVLTLLLCAEEGFACETSYDVATCVERLRAASPPFDVLLLDLLLPDGRCGLEVVEASHADPSLHLPPVVVCTALGNGHLSAYRPALNASGARLVAKPFDSDALFAELRAAARG